MATTLETSFQPGIFPRIDSLGAQPVISDSCYCNNTTNHGGQPFIKWPTRFSMPNSLGGVVSLLVTSKASHFIVKKENSSIAMKKGVMKEFKILS